VRLRKISSHDLFGLCFEIFCICSSNGKFVFSLWAKGNKTPISSALGRIYHKAMNAASPIDALRKAANSKPQYQFVTLKD
jgi:hypothetical protein